MALAIVVMAPPSQLISIPISAVRQSRSGRRLCSQSVRHSDGVAPMAQASWVSSNSQLLAVVMHSSGVTLMRLMQMHVLFRPLSGLIPGPVLRARPAQSPLLLRRRQRWATISAILCTINTLSNRAAQAQVAQVVLEKIVQAICWTGIMHGVVPFLQ